MTVEYTYAIDREKETKWKSYVARITGSDAKYILCREFEHVQFFRTFYGHSCTAYLDTGLYEVCISRYDARTGERLCRQRWWIIIADDDLYEYEYEEMNWQYALFTAYNLKANYGNQQ